MCDQFLQGFSPDHRDAQHFLVVGFLLAVVAHHHFVGDEGDPKDSEAAMSGYNYLWDSAHAYRKRGKDQNESGFTPKSLQGCKPQSYLQAHALVSFPPALCLNSIIVKGCDMYKAQIAAALHLQLCSAQ